MSPKIRFQLVSSTLPRHAGRVTGLVVVLALVAGCGGPSGPPRAAVHGEVTFDQSPLKAGVIRFVPTGAPKGPVALATIKDGRYDLSWSDGPALGDNAVEIVPGLDENPLDGATDIRAAWADYAKTVALNREGTTPRKFKSDSEMKVNVQGQHKNTFDFSLASQ
jgi:hypothetical protein